MGYTGARTISNELRHLTWKLPRFAEAITIGDGKETKEAVVFYSEHFRNDQGFCVIDRVHLPQFDLSQKQNGLYVSTLIRGLIHGISKPHAVVYPMDSFYAYSEVPTELRSLVRATEKRAVLKIGFKTYKFHVLRDAPVVAGMSKKKKEQENG